MPFQNVFYLLRNIRTFFVYHWLVFSLTCFPENLRNYTLSTRVHFFFLAANERVRSKIRWQRLIKNDGRFSLARVRLFCKVLFLECKIQRVLKLRPAKIFTAIHLNNKRCLSKTNKFSRIKSFILHSCFLLYLKQKLGVKTQSFELSLKILYGYILYISASIRNRLDIFKT